MLTRRKPSTGTSRAIAITALKTRQYLPNTYDPVRHSRLDDTPKATKGFRRRALLHYIY